MCLNKSVNMILSVSDSQSFTHGHGGTGKATGRDIVPELMLVVRKNCVSLKIS